MKANVLVGLFLFIVIACLTISGMESIELMFKSIILVIMLMGLLVVGITYMVNHADENEQIEGA